MNVYELNIWYQVAHNGKFSHTVQRTEVIHALNEERALGKIVLAGKRSHVAGTLTIDVTAEFIYESRRTGTVVKKMYYEYSDGRNPRPV
ncbi:hypothetical protein LCGC14_1380020 [marine sediment metagenome]|uniref:Uncharacterized protein n=1 Tax=marine sediment metagenome TaxID=412755 RepID=A0A0F9KNS3_9ZZZZ